MIRAQLLAVVVGLLTFQTAAVAQDKPKKDDFRKPVNQWVGVIKDEKLRAQAKAGEVITDADTFEKLWKAWQPKVDLPKVDFATQFVLVVVSDYEPEFLSLYGGPMWKGSNSNKSPKQIKGGFGWGVGVYDRKGIDEVNGKKLDTPKEKKEK